MWDINVACFPHSDKNDRRRIRSLIRQLSEFSLMPRQSPYDLAPEGDRIRMIGSAISAGRLHGYDWLAHHPRQASWLVEHGISAERCVEEHRRWFEGEMDKVQWSDQRKEQKQDG